MLSRATGFPAGEFISSVYLRSLFIVLPCAALVPVLFEMVKPEALLGVLCSVALCLIWAAATVYVIGMNSDERKMVKGLLLKRRGA